MWSILFDFVYYKYINFLGGNPLLNVFYVVYYYYDKRPNLSVYDSLQNVASDSVNTFEFSAT